MINLNFKEIHFILYHIIIYLLDLNDDKEYSYDFKNFDFKKLQLILNFYNNGNNKFFIEEAKQSFFDELLLKIRGIKNKKIDLFFKISNNYNFICSGKPIVVLPKNPLIFTILLKKNICGKKIEKINIVENDRIFWFEFNEFKLIFELLGKDGNIFLTDRENKILGKLIKKKSKIREDDVGNVYDIIEKSNDNKKDFQIRENFSSYKNIYQLYLKEIEENYLEFFKKDLEEKSSKIENKLNKLKKELRSDEEIELLRKKGDLIISNIELVNKFLKDEEVKRLKKIKLKDFNGVEEVEIDINPLITSIQNANFFYEKYKEEKKKKNEILNYINYLNNKLKKIKENKNNEKESLNKKNSEKKYDEETYRKILKVEIKLKEKNRENLPFYKFVLTTNEIVFVGKSSSSNILLVKKYSRGEDYWFHVRDYSGSYVILKVENKEKNLDPQTLKEAAMLALYFSKGRKAGKADVIYTKVKYLKFVNKEKGKIIYTNDKNIFIEIDENYIKILKDRIKE
jgi:predicted ribosome quality control (RQC) complex YloA/Tae2 family protein